MNYHTANGRIEIAWPNVTLHSSCEPVDPIEIDAQKFRVACWDAFVFGTTQRFQDGFYEVSVRWGGVIVRDVLTGHIVRSDSFADSSKIARAIGKVRAVAIADEGVAA